MRILAASALVCALIVLPSCGSSRPKLYSLEKTKSCLVAKHVPTGGRLDFVATTATGGAFKAHFGANFVTVVFGATQTDANNIYQAYVNFHARNVGISDVLRQQQNAVMLWHAHPSDNAASTVTGCLR
ncbi:MAG TPA: hypothetical protein VFA05_01770 [Gaiellaceae bacterium]|nr:hypothetical protein [Gaiellaceae bacterium]